MGTPLMIVRLDRPTATVPRPPGLGPFGILV